MVEAKLLHAILNMLQVAVVGWWWWVMVVVLIIIFLFFSINYNFSTDSICILDITTTFHTIPMAIL
jgi:hypothetical protein